MTPEQLNQLVQLLATVTLMEMMATIGLGVTVAETVSVARDARLVVKVGLANYVAYPAVAVGLLLAFHSAPMVAAGFLIAAVCPGAPYGPALTGLARGNVPTAVGLMVLLAGSSAVVAPLLLRLLLPVVSGGADLEVDSGRLIGTLLGVQFLPLCAGLAVRRWWPTFADKARRPAGVLSTVLNLTLLGLILVSQYATLAQIPARGFGGMALLVLAGLALGWLAGGSRRDVHIATAMATAVRNAGVTLVIATASFPGTPAVTAATAFGVFQTVLLAIIALGWGRLTSTGAATPLPAADDLATQTFGN